MLRLNKLLFYKHICQRVRRNKQFKDLYDHDKMGKVPYRLKPRNTFLKPVLVLLLLRMRIIGTRFKVILFSVTRKYLCSTVR